MLRSLSLKNFAIVESASLSLEPGFTAITGETGAGKSILVDAVGLLVGDRAETSWVREGSSRAELTAEFEINGHPALMTWLSEHALDDGEDCLLRRVISENGRSRAFINGTPVTVSQLSGLGRQLVEIHGQHSFQTLTTPARQRSLLDASGVDQRLLDRVSDRFHDWQDARSAFAQFEQQLEAGDTDLDYLRFQIRELKAAALPEDEYADLEQRHRLASHAGELLTHLNRATALISEDDGNALDQLSGAISAVSRALDTDPDLEDIRQMLESAQINLQEAAQGLRAHADAIDLDPEALQSIDEQMSVIHQLARKHRVEPAELASRLDQFRTRLQQLENADAERNRLETAVADAEKAYRTAAGTLSKARQQQADELGQRAAAALHTLGMEGASVSIEVEHDPQAQPTAHGSDQVDILASLNAGHPALPIRKVASGGELSRLSLALKIASRAAGGAPTLIFDEVDAGIGGETAHQVGTSLKQLADSAQTLCVTHLAQVAARADQQFSVRKLSGDELTAVTTSQVRGQARVQEIARMLGGETSDQGLAHAESMLSGHA